MCSEGISCCLIDFEGENEYQNIGRKECVRAREMFDLNDVSVGEVPRVAGRGVYALTV